MSGSLASHTSSMNTQLEEYLVALSLFIDKYSIQQNDPGTSILVGKRTIKTLATIIRVGAKHFQRYIVANFAKQLAQIKSRQPTPSEVVLILAKEIIELFELLRRLTLLCPVGLRNAARALKMHFEHNHEIDGNAAIDKVAKIFTQLFLIPSLRHPGDFGIRELCNGELTPIRTVAIKLLKCFTAENPVPQLQTLAEGDVTGLVDKIQTAMHTFMRDMTDTTAIKAATKLSKPRVGPETAVLMALLKELEVQVSTLKVLPEDTLNQTYLQAMKMRKVASLNNSTEGDEFDTVQKVVSPLKISDKPPRASSMPQMGSRIEYDDGIFCRSKSLASLDSATSHGVPLQQYKLESIIISRLSPRKSAGEHITDRYGHRRRDPSPFIPSALRRLATTTSLGSETPLAFNTLREIEMTERDHAGGSADSRDVR